MPAFHNVISILRILRLIFSNKLYFKGFCFFFRKPFFNNLMTEGVPSIFVDSIIESTAPLIALSPSMYGRRPGYSDVSFPIYLTNMLINLPMIRFFHNHLISLDAD